MKVKLIKKDKVMKGKLKKIENGYALDSELGIAFVSTVRTEHRWNKLSLKNCQAIERGYDLNELAENYTKFMNDDDETSDIDFKVGFQKALEILGDKKFSEEDIRRALSAGLSIGYGRQFEIENKQIEIDSYMNSLQQTEWEVEIQMDVYDCTDECEHMDEWDLCYNDGCKISQLKPKLDSNGCIILKRI